MLSTLRFCGNKNLLTRETLSLVSSSKFTAETILRRNYASLLFSKTKNIKGITNKSKRFFSTEVVHLVCFL